METAEEKEKEEKPIANNPSEEVAKKEGNEEDEKIKTDENFEKIVAETQAKRESKVDPVSLRYTTLKHVGQGSYGVVCKSTDTTTKKSVAIKKVTFDSDGKNREMKMLEDLSHPNCITVKNSFRSEEFEKGKIKRYLHIVMEYIPDNLCKIIRHYPSIQKPFPETLAMLYSYQLFRCLHYLQAVKVMHRDIKPQNLLVDTKTQRLLFCDFGSAKKVNLEDENISYICSRYYRAPELLMGGKHYGCGVDTWSVGCVVAEMFLGKPLFIGNDTKDQIIKIAEMLGIPTDSDLRAMGVKPLPDSDFKDLEVKSLKERLAGKASPAAIDLLMKTLTYDPEKRIKPVEALLHSYYDLLRQKKITINKHEIVDMFNFVPEEVAGNERLVKRLTPAWYYKKGEPGAKLATGNK